MGDVLIQGSVRSRPVVSVQSPMPPARMGCTPGWRGTVFKAPFGSMQQRRRLMPWMAPNAIDEFGPVPCRRSPIAASLISKLSTLFPRLKSCCSARVPGRDHDALLGSTTVIARPLSVRSA